MQVELAFIFPHVLRELPVSFLVPLPAQRPHTVANLTFMCTGQLPLADELLSALHLTQRDIAYASADEAKAAGLLPFSESAVIRIDKTTVMEIGSSTTHSIFGGFVPDEAVQLPADTAARGQSIAATMSSFKAGTLLYGNLGLPNSQASRYYILLSSLTTSAQKEEFSGFAPLGMVTSGLEELQRAVQHTAVQPRTLVPKRKVVVSACRMQLDPAQLTTVTSSPFPATVGNGCNAEQQQPAQARRQAEPQARIAGRVRRRDEDDEEEQQQQNARDGDADSGADAAGTSGAVQGFFRVSARFPKAVAQAVAVSAGGGLNSNGAAALKRRRAEAYVPGPDGVAVLRTTAIAPGEGGSGDGDGEGGFHFFAAQQDAFMNDIATIKDTQRDRQIRSSSKNKKRDFYKKGGRHSGQKKKFKSTSTSTSGSRAGSKVKKGKKILKRY